MMGDAVTSAGPYANNLHVTPDRHKHLNHSIFTGQMWFLMHKQQRQITEGTQLQKFCRI